MAKKKHLIIGSGSAGLSALEEIRRLNSEDEIKIVTMEDYPPYSPAVLPYLVSGETRESDIWIRNEDYFQKMKCTFVKGKEIIQVAPKKKEVIYRDRDRDSYDTLLIASGSEPAEPPITGSDETGLLGFHTLSDCKMLLEQLKEKRVVAVYGGGLVATELAMSLLKRGNTVKMVVRSRILRTYFDEDVGVFITNILQDKGATIFQGNQISEARRNKRGIEISLSSGSSIDADILVTAVGVKPRISYLQDAGFKISSGLVVDNRMMTNIEDVYAAGDVAEAPDFFTGEYGMNQIIESAVDEGKVAGANMTGTATEYEGWISSNIFNFFGNTAFSAGLSIPGSNDYQVLTEKNDKKSQFKKLVFDGDRLVGAMFVNVELDPGVILYLMRKKINLADYKSILFKQPREISRWLMLATEQKESAPIQG